MKKLHFWVGFTGLVIFIIQGQYMHRSLGHLLELEDGVRMMYRTSHVYLFLASAMNVLLGTWSLPRKSSSLFSIGISVIFLAAPFLLLASFFLESESGDLERPITFYTMVVIFAAVSLLSIIELATLPFIAKWLEWHRLPVPFGLLKLIFIRNRLRRENLTDAVVFRLEKTTNPEEVPAEKTRFRSFNGYYNDLKYPRMGAANTRFGRNIPLKKAYPDIANLMNPNPRLVSRTLLTRDEFKPARILNLMAASWVQFQVHDWFAHKEGDDSNSFDIPVEKDDPWPDKSLRVPRTPAENEQPGCPPTYANLNTHWWDGSQLYGSDRETSLKLRTLSDGKLKMGDAALLPLDVEGVELTGFSNNWWIGLSMLHALFAAEHNQICDRLRSKYTQWSDEQLFQQARLINAALMARIHTIEWTPAILPHRTVVKALQTNWSGLLGKTLQKIFPVLNRSELLGGIPGSRQNHHGVAYSLTEEFVAVYRMHPLMPDDFPIYSLQSGQQIGSHNLLEVSLTNTRSIMEQYKLADLFYSFGISHPGALTLHNYPKHLQLLVKEDGSKLDLASVDIIRDRERGIPRYNEFRELLHLKPVSKFEELTENKIWAEEIRSVYKDDIDKVDLMIGLLAEPLIKGFGFSETAFHIFIVMASRRLKSDRFFTDAYNEEVYTKLGLQWIEQNTMRTLLTRHYPALEPALQGVENAFQPWKSLAR